MHVYIERVNKQKQWNFLQTNHDLNKHFFLLFLNKYCKVCVSFFRIIIIKKKEITKKKTNQPYIAYIEEKNNQTKK